MDPTRLAIIKRKVYARSGVRRHPARLDGRRKFRNLSVLHVRPDSEKECQSKEKTPLGMVLFQIRHQLLAVPTSKRSGYARTILCVGTGATGLSAIQQRGFAAHQAKKVNRSFR